MKNWEDLGRCPFCGKKLPSPSEVSQHEAEIADRMEALREASPEVAVEEVETGCENLAPRVGKPHRVYPAGEPGWKRDDFSRNLGNEEVE